jgi:hypothetical protein
VLASFVVTSKSDQKHKTFVYQNIVSKEVEMRQSCRSRRKEECNPRDKWRNISLLATESHHTW